MGYTVSAMIWTPPYKTNTFVCHYRAVGGFSGKNFLNSVEFLDPGEEWTSYLPVTDDKDPAVKDEGDEKENENPDIVIETAKSNGDE